MKKLLVALQFWPGDRDMAMMLARLIADLEPEHSNYADFMFCPRFDTEVDKATYLYAARKFNVLTHKSRRIGATGWPYGPNEQWFDLMVRCWEFVKHDLPPYNQYSGVLCLEADDCPLVKGWLYRIKARWDELNSDGKSCGVMGAFLPAPGPHINGNAVFSLSGDFLHMIAREAGCDPTSGWDYVMYPKFNRFGAIDTPLIRSFWRQSTMDDSVYDNLVSQGAVMLHGTKDLSLQRIVRRRLLGKGANAV